MQPVRAVVKPAGCRQLDMDYAHGEELSVVKGYLRLRRLGLVSASCRKVLTSFGDGKGTN